MSVVRVPPRQLYGRQQVIDMVAFDRAASRSYSHGNPHQPLTLNLSEGQYIGHDLLLLLISVIAERAERGLLTCLELPQTKAPIEFLRAWNFLEHAQVLQPDFDVLAPRSRTLWDQITSTPPEYVSYRIDTSGVKYPVRLRESLAISEIDLSRERWSVGHQGAERILELNLQVVLAAAYNHAIPPTIADMMREMVMNTRHHPSAKRALTSAQMLTTVDYQESTAMVANAHDFELAVWDNGTSIPTTLNSQLAAGLPIITDLAETETVVFDVEIEDAGEKSSITLSDPHEIKQGNADLLTCAAFMLGVTSRPDRPDDPFALPGRAGEGLANVRRAALDTLRGRIRYRNSDLQLEASCGKRPAHYTFRLNRNPSNFWPIQGNLLIVDMPLDRTTHDESARIPLMAPAGC